MTKNSGGYMSVDRDEAIAANWDLLVRITRPLVVELKQKWETACWSRELHLKENDELKQYKIAALKELHRLKAENEILTKVNSDSISILEENQKLSSRIAKLEHEIKVLRNYGNKDCTAMADEALTQDDEMEKK